MCSSDLGAAGALNINVILKTTASEYWGYVMAGAQAYAKDHPEVKVDVQGASSETAYDEQLNIIETNMAANKYNGFVIAPLQADMVQTSSSRVIFRWAGSAASVRNQRPASCRAARPLPVSWSTQRAGSLLRKCPARRGSTSQSGAKGA